MKKGKSEKVIFALMLSAIITLGSLGIAKTGPASNRSSNVTYPVFEVLHGTIEFNLVPPGDTRVWHIENNYNTFRPGDTAGYNTSEYNFKRDSVIIVNKYAGMPDQNP